MTKKYRLFYWILAVFSILLNFCPLAIYCIKALMAGDLIYEKVTLTMTVFVVVILTIVGIVNKVALRSRLWIILIGVYICLNDILTPLIIIAVCQTLDEIVINPLKKHYSNKLTISKEIDKRL